MTLLQSAAFCGSRGDGVGEGEARGLLAILSAFAIDGSSVIEHDPAKGSLKLRSASLKALA
jgi:hypothetical protein